MLSKTTKGHMAKSTELNSKRRQLIRAGLSGIVLVAGAVSVPCLAAVARPVLNFGENYTVKKVFELGRYTHVELGFRVNGRFFTTHLRSSDRKVWRPV